VIGYEAELYVDANGAYTRKQARVARRQHMGDGSGISSEKISSPGHPN
jgi:hypothetical protein